MAMNAKQVIAAILFVGAQVASWADINSGLVVHYELNGDALDSSGNDRNGLLNGPVPAEDRFGNLSGALQFNGADYVLASADGLPSAERTVALWFFASDIDAHPVLLGYGGGGCGTSWFEGLNLGNSSSYYVGVHCGVYDFAVGYGTPPVQKWTHLAITTSTNGTKIYVGGQLVGSNATFINNTLTYGSDLSLGVATNPDGLAPYTDSNIGYFQGRLDDVRIYDRALSDQEIQLLTAVPEPSTLLFFAVGLLAGLTRFMKKTH